MKKIILTTYAFLILLLSVEVSAQTAAPYTVSPKWAFGAKGYFSFNTATGALTQPTRTDNIIANEGGSTLCDSNKAVAIYTNNVRIGGGDFNPLTSFMTGSSSSTQGGVIIPNPSDPYGKYFIITGNAEEIYDTQEPNDQRKQGVKVYSSNKSSTTVTAPTLVSDLLNDSESREDVSTSTDGAYGYWIVSPKIISENTVYNSWRIPATTGTLGGKVTSAGATNITNEQYQGSVKFNRCQTLVAFVQGSSIQIFEWDKTTGKTGAQKVRYINTSPSSKYYGAEFSLNGDYLFVSTLATTPLTRVTVSTGAVTTMGNASGSLQMGPNGIIYVANGLDGSTNTNVGTITNADAGGTYNPTGLALANSSTVRLGISNQPWINPRKPTIKAVLNSCGSYTFTPEFLTYFKDDININKAVWTLTDPSATVTNTGANSYNSVSHTYATSGTKTITVKVTDVACAQDWTGTLSLNVPCALPIELISFTATANPANKSVLLNWATATETNNNYFEIQRSEDGIHFTTIQIVKGKGTTTGLSEYSFVDLYPSSGTNYYQLVQYDFDGAHTSSEIVTAKLTAVEVKVFPNPSEGEFNVSISSVEPADIIVYDVVGAEVFKTRSENISSLSFGKDFSKGTYILKYVSASESKSLKLEKL